MFVITLAGSCVNFAAAGDSSSQGLVFVDAESLPEEFRNTTLSIVIGFNRGDIDSLEKYFDFEAVAVTGGKDLFNSDRDYRDFVRGVKFSKRNVITALVKQIETTDGVMTLTGYAKRTQGVMPQVRIDMGDYGLEYIEFLFDKKKDGSYQVVDWYQLSTGRMASQTIGIVARVLVDPNPGILKKLFGITNVDNDIMEAITSIGSARRSGDYAEANRFFLSLPPQIKDSRIFLELGIAIANLLQDEALHKKRLKLLAEIHGADPSAASLLIDHYYYLGDADKALSYLDVMERQVGKDGYTTYLRANLYFKMVEDYGKAKALYLEAIDIEPDLEDPYTMLAYIYILERNHAKAVEVYKLLESNFGIQYTREDFFDMPETNLFKASGEFEKWMNTR